MNGAVPSLFDPKERVLKLGESFEKQPRCAFHTVRCERGAGAAPQGTAGPGGISAPPRPPLRPGPSGPLRGGNAGAAARLGLARRPGGQERREGRSRPGRASV